RRQIQTIDGLERLYLFQRLLRKGCLSFKSVQDDAFDKIAERHVELGSKCFQDLQQAAFDPNARLNTRYLFHGMLLPCYHMVDQGARQPVSLSGSLVWVDEVRSRPLSLAWGGGRLSPFRRWRRRRKTGRRRRPRAPTRPRRAASRASPGPL